MLECLRPISKESMNKYIKLNLPNNLELIANSILDIGNHINSTSINFSEIKCLKKVTLIRLAINSLRLLFSNCYCYKNNHLIF